MAADGELLGNDKCQELTEIDISEELLGYDMNAGTGVTDSEKPKAISLFSGLGGFDIGLHRAGVETLVCVDNDPDAIQTLKSNSSRYESVQPPDGIPSRAYPWLVLDRDIRDLSGQEILDSIGAEYGEIDLIVGGPPCQTFSRSNEGDRRGAGVQKGMLFREFARIVQEVRPKAFIFENVRGLSSANDGRDLELILRTLSGEEFGDPPGGSRKIESYSQRYQVVNAADFGVPQTRKRLLILGSRHRTPASIAPTQSKNEWVPAGKALSKFDLDRKVERDGGYQNAVGGQYGHLLRDIPPGANYQHFSERRYVPESGDYIVREQSEIPDKKVFDWRSRHWNYLLKQDPCRPAWTIQATPGTYVGPFHWRSRPLSILEQMRLQDIPIDYYISGDRQAVQRQLGNAIPPGLAYEAVSSILGGSRMDSNARSGVVHADGGEAPIDCGQEGVMIEGGESPWEHASSLLGALEHGSGVTISARGSRIAQAIDVGEITRRSTSMSVHVTLDRSTVEVEDDHPDSLSAVAIELHPTGQLK